MAILGCVFLLTPLVLAYAYDQRSEPDADDEAAFPKCDT